MSHELVGKTNHQQGGIIVKKTIIGLICALVTPLAFAQTNTTTTEETTTTKEPVTSTQTTTTHTAGTVTTYEPGKTVVVKSDQGPVSFALGTAARIVDATGQSGEGPAAQWSKGARLSHRPGRDAYGGASGR
jgi:hypothetical protein